MPANLDNRASHVGGRQALPPVHSANVKVYGPGAGLDCLGGGRAKLGGRDWHRRMIGR